MGHIERLLQQECYSELSKARERIAELEEERRWRKYPEDAPTEEDVYDVIENGGVRHLNVWKKGIWGFPNVRYWRTNPPLPEPPKEE